MSYSLLAAAIACEVVATTALGASDGFSRIVPTGVALAGYGVAFYLLSLAVATIPIGVAYAVWSGVGIVAISLIGWLVFGQKLDLAAIGGMAMIVGGVIMIKLLSATAG